MYAYKRVVYTQVQQIYNNKTTKVYILLNKICNKYIKKL